MTPTDNKRRAHRLQHEIAVAYRSVGSFLSDWATNISRGGLFINTRSPLPVGTAVRIVIQLPGASFPCRLEGRVARVHAFANGSNLAPGMAIEFVALPDAARRDIDAFVERLRGQLEQA